MDDDHPHAFRQTSELRSIAVRCHLCGFQVTLDRKALDRMTAVRTFGHIWRMAFCPTCKEAGEDRLTMSLTTDWDVAPFEPRTIVVGRRAPPEVAPTRPGPFEHLPRRALYRRKRLAA